MYLWRAITEHVKGHITHPESEFSRILSWKLLSLTEGDIKSCYGVCCACPDEVAGNRVTKKRASHRLTNDQKDFNDRGRKADGKVELVLGRTPALSRREAMQTSRSKRLSHLVNIGAKTEQLLNEVEVWTQQELQEMGPMEAWKRIKALHPELATLTCLYSLQGALLGVPWSHLPQEIAEELLKGVRWN